MRALKIKILRQLLKLTKSIDHRLSRWKKKIKINKLKSSDQH